MLIHVQVVLSFLFLRLEQFWESQTPMLRGFDLVFTSEDLCQTLRVIMPVDIRVMSFQYTMGCLPRESCHVWVAIDLISHDWHPLNRLRIMGITASKVLMEPIDPFALGRCLAGSFRYLFDCCLAGSFRYLFNCCLAGSFRYLFDCCLAGSFRYLLDCCLA